MRLSIVVVSWNTRDMTLALLDRLAEQGLAGAAEASASAAPGALAGVELIVVDNGSDDGTAEAVRARHPGVELVALPANLGFATGCNAALRRARGRAVLLLNSDVVPEREAILRCVAFLEERPDVGAVGVQLLHPDGRLQNSIHATPTLSGEIVPRALLETLFPARFPSKRRALAGPTDVEAVLGACLALRREVLERVGLLCEDYFFFLEETDLCLRMRRAGFRVVHLPDVRLVHRSGASSKKKMPGATRIEYHRSLYRFFHHHRSPGARSAVVVIGGVKGVIAWIGKLPAALVSARGREALRDRWQVLRWHLRGRPAEAGLATAAWRDRHARPGP